MNDENDNNDYGSEVDFDEYNDQDATDCANGDYNTWEENEVAKDNERDNEVEDQLLDMEMEDRIGGTGVPDFESWDGDSDGSVGCD